MRFHLTRWVLSLVLVALLVLTAALAGAQARGNPGAGPNPKAGTPSPGGDPATVAAPLFRGERGPTPGAGGTVPWSRWVSVGPGGGGHLRYPSISPHAPDLYFVCCDMGGVYRSADRGRQWRMDATVHGPTSPVMFHPTDPNVAYVFAIEGAEFNHGWTLFRSGDQGLTWKVLHHYQAEYQVNSGQCLALDAKRPGWMLAGMAGPLPGRILRSTNEGNFWQAAEKDIPIEADVQGLAVDPASPADNRRIVAGTTAGVYVSADDGQTWTLSAAQPGDGKVSHLLSSTDKSGAWTLYAITDGLGGRSAWYSGGKKLSRSTDGGRSWQDLTAALAQAAQRQSLTVRVLAVNDAAPQVLYASVTVPNRAGTYKSGDGGKTWAYQLPGDEFYETIHGPKHSEGSHYQPGWIGVDPHFSWGWGGEASYMCVSPTDPNRVLQTDDGRIIGSADGGAHWEQLYTDRVQDNGWASRGVEVTNCYQVYFNPSDHNRMFIAYTDIGFFRSQDRGASWTFSLHGGKYRNTVYDLAIDPDNPQVMYAATSLQHDLPEFKVIKNDERTFKGGIAKTTDGGLNWTMIGEGSLPPGACTGIVLDPRSPAGKRTLFVAVIGFGVYRSRDGGETWALVDKGMDYLKLNANAFRLSLGVDGVLYAVICKNIDRPDPTTYHFAGGTMYRSEDGGDHWVRIAPSKPAEPSGKRNEFANIWDVTASPCAPGTVYAAACEDRHCGPPVAGGGWKSTDKGDTWQRVFVDEEVTRISPHPTDPRIIYACSNRNGLFGTLDGGVTWNQIKGLPFPRPRAVTIDPDHPETIWVATFGGGVWKGPARGDDAQAGPR